METKNYSAKVCEIKNEVLDEIRKILGADKRHKFVEPFYVHFVDGEVATTEYCLAVEVWSNGTVVFCTGNSLDTPREKENVTEGIAVYHYEPNSFFDILENLEKEIREERLQTLRELVKNAGGTISFDGNFKFDSLNFEDEDDDKIYSNTELWGLSVMEDGTLNINNYWGIEYNDPEGVVPTYELDHIIEYVRKQTEKTPEERLALTDEQKFLVEQFNDIVRKMKDANIKLLLEENTKDFYAININEVEDLDSSYYVYKREDKDSYVEIPAKSNLICKDVIGYYLYEDESLYAKFK